MNSLAKSLLVILCFFSYLKASTQESDSSLIINNEFISNQLENISASQDISLDFSDLLEDYAYYNKNPISINGENCHKLVELLLIDEIQYNNIQVYLSNYGSLQSKAELLAIDGFSKPEVERLLPFISFTSKKKKNKYKIKDVFKYGRHQLISRYSQIIEQAEAYDLPNDSALQHKGSVYLGNPQKYYSRYSFDFYKKVGFGFTVEKDAGELLSSSRLNDSLKSLVGEKVSLIDFSSAYLYVSDIGIIKKLIVGDYHLEFGQGLTLWSGLSFGKSSDATMLKKYGRGLVKNSSVNENRFMRGAAISLGIKKIELTVFYSTNNIDANVTSIDSLENKEVSGVQESGNHRTINELLDRKVMNIRSLGGNISYKSNNFSLGYRIISNTFNLKFAIPNEIYKQYYFVGKNNLNMGLDFTYNLKNMRFFGEISANENYALAGIIGSNTFIGNRVVLSLLYRNYSKNYYNFFNSPISESSHSRNERAFYMGIKLMPIKNITIDAYADFFKFPWLKYGVSYPSQGAEYLVQINYNPLNNFGLYFRMKSEFKSENYKEEYKFLPQQACTKKYSFRINLTYSPIEFITLKSRFEAISYSKSDKKERGYLLYQDINYKPINFPLSANLRFAIFSTDGWDSRIYAYENDVLYAFSIPAYYEKGQRFYFNIKYKLNRHLSFWFRLSRIVFDHKTSIGSGANKIDGNHKTEIKLQLKANL